MSKSTVEQALISLIPTLNGPLPVELVELAISLLSLSRSLAHSLRPEEEIARPYACAQLASERLKTRLNLPSLQPQPPCPPRIYKKLYQYLESAMPAAATRTPKTPRKTAPHGSASNPSLETTPVNNRRTPRRIAKDVSTAPELPDWVMPTIRSLLKEFSYPLAAPHVFTGVESISPLLTRMLAAGEPSIRRPTRGSASTQTDVASSSQTRIIALIAVVLFYVLSKMLGQQITPQQFLQWRNKAISSLLRSEAGKTSSEEEVLAEIEKLMPMAQEEGWLQMEWFLNIVPETRSETEGVEISDTVTPHSQGGNRKSMRDNFASEYIGLGTMMQDATDYLGERQREEYKRWKTKILAQMGENEE